MKISLSALWIVAMSVSVGCSLIPDPDPYPSGDASQLDATQAANDIDFGNLPPVNDPSTRDAALPDAQEPSLSMDAGQVQADAEASTSSNQCQERCEASEQCSAGHECVDGHCRSVEEFDICRDPDFCLAALSEWTSVCSLDADCMGDDEACIRVGQEGRCAPVFTVGGCLDSEFGELARLRFADDQGRVSVCGQVRAVCRSGLCVLRCGSDEHCVDTQRPRCDVDSGYCVCTAESCTINASLCGALGRCQCAADSDCTEGPVDTCFAGACGCSGPGICPPATHPGTEVICEPRTAD
jgi:hypothetical protein